MHERLAGAAWDRRSEFTHSVRNVPAANELGDILPVLKERLWLVLQRDWNV
jgi:hypothetical protein